MIAHLAMMSHPDPKKVLVVGGGDGGVLREVVKHEAVEEATLCDIDEVRLHSEQTPNLNAMENTHSSTGCDTPFGKISTCNGCWPKASSCQSPHW